MVLNSNDFHSKTNSLPFQGTARKKKLKGETQGVICKCCEGSMCIHIYFEAAKVEKSRSSSGLVHRILHERPLPRFLHCLLVLSVWVWVKLLAPPSVILMNRMTMGRGEEGRESISSYLFLIFCVCFRPL